MKRGTEDGEYAYGYDQLSRLTQVKPPQSAQDKGLPVESYAYDTVHNRIGSSHQAGEWLYNQDNQLLKFGVDVDETSYTYTANGHVATETRNGVIRTYTYDAADRLVRVAQTLSGSETEIAKYSYDPFGRRISKTVNGETIYFIYTDEGMIAELNEGGDIARAYGWELNSMYGTVPLWQAEVTNNKLGIAQFHTLITDHLGTPQMAVNDQGQVTWKAVSESFGKTIADSGNQITMNLRFPGQYFDEEAGTHYNYFRDYNPNTGRYIQKDPIGLNAGINWFGYVNGNPNVYIDSRGLQALDSVSNACLKNPALCATIGGGAIASASVDNAAISSTAGISNFDRFAAFLRSTAANNWQLFPGLTLSRQLEYERAKNLSDWADPCMDPRKPDCSALSKAIDRIEFAIVLYIAWDLKWQPGRHATKIVELRRRLENLKALYNKYCVNKF